MDAFSFPTAELGIGQECSFLPLLPMKILATIHPTLSTSSYSLFLAGLFAISSSLASAQVFNVDIVTDNDFAIYLGTDTGPGGTFEWAYDNASDWPQQLAANAANLVSISNPNNLPYLYVFLRNLGTQGNLSGSINGINVVNQFAQNPSSVRMAGFRVEAQLPAWARIPGNTVAQDAIVGPDPLGSLQSQTIHSEVLSLFGSSFNFAWTDPVPGIDVVGAPMTVTGFNPDAAGPDVFDLDGDSDTTETVRHGFRRVDTLTNEMEISVFRFGTVDFGTGGPMIPEPSAALMGAIGSFLLLRRRRPAA